MAHYKKRGSKWSCYYYITDLQTGKAKQKTESGFLKKRDAVAWNTNRENELLRGFHGTPHMMTVADYAAEWFSSRRPTDYAEATLHSYHYLVNSYIAPHIGTVRLSKLDDRKVQAWHSTLFAAGLSSGTVVAAHRVLSLLLNDAVRRKRLGENPARLAGAPKLERKPRTQAWNLDQVQRFLKVADGHPQGLVYRLMLMTGIRPGEALTLRWSDIDWRRGTIAITRTRTRDSEGRHIIGDRVKTPSSQRTITLQQGLADRLRQHRIKQNEHRLQYTARWHDLELVFPRDDGTMQNDQTFAPRLKRMAVKAGVPPLSPHGLRHSAATMMVAMGEHPEAISEILGHKNVSTTMDLYSHLDESMRRPTAERLERLIDSRADDDTTMTNRN